MPKTIMFVHGAWVTSSSWDSMRGYFEAAGYTCVAPAWPHVDRDVESLRRDPHPDLAHTTVASLADHFEREAAKLSEPPILIGHSFGGLITQTLLDRGVGSMAAILVPAPARGVFPPWRAIRSALPIFTTWRGWSRTLVMSFASFAETFANTLPEREMRPAYDRHIVPTPGRIFFQAALGIGNGVNFRNPNRAPLLVIAADEDKTVPPELVRSTYRKQSLSPSRTDFAEFPGMSHWLMAEPGWERVAAKILGWIEDVERGR